MECDAMKVAGFGFRKGASVESLAAAFTRAGGAADVFATVTAKADAPCLTELAARFGVEVRLVNADDLPKAKVTTQSEKSTRLFGTGSLSEAAALIAAGPGARLITARVISPDSMATCAIAERSDA
jgi:cobalt-precorrin 5A hydrolase